MRKGERLKERDIRSKIKRERRRKREREKKEKERDRERKKGERLCVYVKRVRELESKSSNSK